MIRLKKNTIVILSIIIVLFGYLGMFNKYRMIPSIILMICLTCNILHTRKIGKIELFQILQLILVLYVFFSALFNNTKTGFEYLPIIINGFLVTEVFISIADYLDIKKTIEKISVIFALYTLVNRLYPDLTIIIFGWFLSSGQLATMKMNIAIGSVPGIAGEASYNAFCIMMGYLAIISRISNNGHISSSDIFKILVMYIAILFTGKRSVLLMAILMLGGVVLFLLFGQKKITISEMIRNTVIVFAIIFLLPLVSNYIIDQVLFRGTSVVQLSNREWFWGMAFELFRKNPIFGSGINTFDFLYNTRKSASGYVYYAGAHNSYIQYLAELGVIGLTLLIAIIFNGIYITINMLKVKDCDAVKKLLLYSLFGQIFVIFYGLTENPFYQPQQALFYYLMISIVLRCKRNNSIVKNVGQNAA